MCCTLKCLSDFISIHSLREEGDCCHFITSQLIHMISIHSLREEGDACGFTSGGTWFISIHSLREEGDITYHLIQQ